MDIKTVFLIFGIGLACYAVILSFAGMRFKDFPSKGALVGLLLVGAILVGGTATFAVKLSIEESHEREEGHDASGEEETEALGIRLIQPADAA